MRREIRHGLRAGCPWSPSPRRQQLAERRRACAPRPAALGARLGPPLRRRPRCASRRSPRRLVGVVVLVRPAGPLVGLLVAALRAAGRRLAAGCSRAAGAYSERVFGTGSDEYRRVGRAGLLLLAARRLRLLRGELDLSRALVVVAVPSLVLVTTLLGRFVARRRLRRLRALGRCTKRVVVGRARRCRPRNSPTRLERERYAGMRGRGRVRHPRRPGAGRPRLAACPSAGWTTSLSMVARAPGADTIAVTSASETAAQYLRQLSWQLEGTGIELLVAPGLIEVAGPRLHIRPFEGLPLLSVEQPRFEGWQRVVKGGVDRLRRRAGAPAARARPAGASPWRSGCPARARCSSGRSGSGSTAAPSRMLKFRSMVVDADARARALQQRRTSPTGCCSRCGATRGSPRSAAGCGGSPWTSCRSCSTCCSGTMSLVGPAAAAARRGRALRRLGPPPAAGQAGADRAVADLRAQRPALGGGGAPRPALRRELVARPGPADPLEDRPRRPEQCGGLLMTAPKKRPQSASEPRSGTRGQGRWLAQPRSSCSWPSS